MTTVQLATPRWTPPRRGLRSRRDVVRWVVAMFVATVVVLWWPVVAGAQSVPGAVSELAASPRSTEVVLTWVAPSSGDAPTGYEYQQKTGSGSYGAWTDIPGSDGDTTSFLVGGLDIGVTYGFKIRGTNVTGDGAESAEVTATVGGSTVYDTDSDNLIEINSLAQLNAIRWDLNADGVPEAKADSYGAAFPDAVAGMGCVPGCKGYELTANLDMDTNGDGKTHEPKFSAGDDCKFENNAWSGDDCDYDTYWNNGAGWEPIGTGAGTEAYWGVFDGNNHTIDHLHISRGTALTGLFGFVEDGSELRNLNVTNARIWAKSERTSWGGRPVGVLVGQSHGSITRVFTSGEVNKAGYLVADYPGSAWRFSAGGVVGYMEGIISRSGSSVEINGNGMFGGIVGFIRADNNRTARVEYSYATGDITFTIPGRYGGLAGVVDDAVVEYSYATGDIFFDREDTQWVWACVGGLVGKLRNGSSPYSIKASYSTGDLSGIQMPVIFTTCGFGGLVGRTDGSGQIPIEDSYALGSVFDVDFNPPCTEHVYCSAGPLVGQKPPGDRLKVVNSFAAGKSSINYHRGVLGRIEDNNVVPTLPTVEHSYWDTDSTPTNTWNVSEFGGGLSRSALQSPTAPPGLDSSGRACDHADYEGDTTFCGWSTSLWDFGDSTQYPRLKVDFNGDGVATADEFGPQAKDIAPRISGRRSITLTQGSEVSDVTLPVAYQGNGALTYAVDSLPAGITLGTDQALSGTPTEAKITKHTMTVTDSDQNRAASDVATATLTFTVRPATPTAPTLTAQPFPGGVRLSWTGGGDYKTGWEYAASEVQGTTGTWTPIQASTGATTSHVALLNAGTTYYLKVRAVNGTEGEAKGAESNEASAVAQAGPPTPTAPTLTAAPRPGGVLLSWTGGGDDKTGWEYASSTEQGTTGEWTAIQGSSGGTTSYTVTQLTTGTTYYFKVRAVNGTLGQVKGAESNEASAAPQAATVTPPPTGPTGPVFVTPISQPTPIEELCPADEVPDAGFTDIAGWPEEFVVAINCMAWYGLTNGTTPTTFSPDRQLTRAQQVLFLQRIRNIATSTETTDTGSFAGNVNAALSALHDLGIIADVDYAAGADGQVGVDRGVFAEGLHKSLRTLSVVFGSTPNPYTDTGDRGVAERQAVTQLADREVMRGVAEGQFAPERPITRAQAVLVMSRVFTLAEITATPTRPS